MWEIMVQYGVEVTIAVVGIAAVIQVILMSKKSAAEFQAKIDEEQLAKPLEYTFREIVINPVLMEEYGSKKLFLREGVVQHLRRVEKFNFDFGYRAKYFIALIAPDFYDCKDEDLVPIIIGADEDIRAGDFIEVIGFFSSTDWGGERITAFHVEQFILVQREVNKVIESRVEKIHQAVYI